MPIHLSSAIRKSVSERIQSAEGNGRYLNVYEAAREVQDNNPQENVALEDIVAALVEGAAGKSLGLEFAQPGTEGLVPIEFVVRETA